MEEVGLPLFVGGFLAVAVLITVLVMSYSYRRRKGLAVLAAELGYTYQREDDRLLEQLDGFRLLPPGHNRRATNVLHGQTGRFAVWLLDFSFHTGGRSSSYQEYTVCVLRAPGLDLPYFSLSCEVPWLSWLGRVLPQPIAGELGSGDIDFPEDEEFSKRFVLQGRGEAVRTLFDARVRQHLMRFAGTLVSVEGRGDTLLFTPGHTVLPRVAREVIQQARDLLGLLARGDALR